MARHTFDTELAKAAAHLETKLERADDPQKVLEHFETKLERLPGVNVFVDDPAIRSQEFVGTDGQHDVFVFDASVQSVNSTQLRNFDPGEDYLIFTSMAGRDLVIGDLGEGYGSNACPTSAPVRQI